MKRNIKKFDEYLNESLLDKLEGPDYGEIEKIFDDVIKKDYLDKKDLNIIESVFKEGLKYKNILNEIRNKEYIINTKDIMILKLMFKYNLISNEEYKELSDKSITKQLLTLAGYERPTGLEQTIPYEKEIPIWNRLKARKLMKKLYNGEVPSWW